MENNKVLISILIPTYNRPEYLKECIDSVSSQQGFDEKDIEVIISDNSDNDKTKIILEKYIIDNPQKKIIYNKNKENLGMVGNWNKLLELKSGEYFIFLSDDDKFYDENSLKELYISLSIDKFDVIYGITRYINEKGDFINENEIKKINNITIKEIKNITKTYLIWRGGMAFGGILYKNSDLRFDTNAEGGADADYNLQYSKNHKIGFLINRTTFLYRVHKENESKNCDFNNSNKYILRKHGVNSILISIILLYSKYIYIIQNIIINILLKIGLYQKIYYFYRKIF